MSQQPTANRRMPRNSDAALVLTRASRRILRPRLRRRVALKLLPLEFTLDHERVSRFKQESRAASALNHPNILTIFEIGEYDGIHFISTEFIDGLTLRQRLGGIGIKLNEVLEIIIQTAGALAAAHEAGILHRDIKPENIMVRPDGYVKVLDFGIAKLTGQFAAGGGATSSGSLIGAVAPYQTDPGKIIGTVHYISPDHLLGQELDGRSDIFSLGVVLYELVAGRTPFEGATTGAVMASILNDDPMPLVRYSRAIPADLERIVEKAPQKDREQRYQVIKDFMIDLKNLKLEIEVEAKLKRGSQAIGDLSRGAKDSQPNYPVSTSLTSTEDNEGRIPRKLEPVGGAVPLESRFYIERATDLEFHEAIERQDSLVLVKGARQVGKTSLLARGLQRARGRGARMVMIDFQSLSQDYFESPGKLTGAPDAGGYSGGPDAKPGQGDNSATGI